MSECTDDPGMAMCDLSNQHLTDEQLSQTLRNVDARVKELRLSRNSLTFVPILNRFAELEWLDLSKNQIREVRHVDQLCNLKCLDLSYNHIQTVDRMDLPMEIEWVDLGHNQITELPDLEHLRKLKHLDLTENQIKRVHSVKPYMRGRYELRENPITHIAPECFRTEELYQCVTEMICDKNSDYPATITQPPVEVLKREWANVVEYFNHRLVSHCRHRILLIGCKKSGKSSLLATLLAERPVLIAIEKRTQMVDVKTLELSDEDFLEVYDQGGHPIYGITSNLFICRKCTVLLVQDVTEPEEMSEMITRFRQVLHKHPDVQIHTVLTHTDKLGADLLRDNREKILEKLNNVLQMEIRNAESYIRHSAATEKNRKYPEKLWKVEQNMQCFCVSSQNYDGITELKEFLHQVAREGAEDIPDHWTKLFVHMKKDEKAFLLMDDVSEMTRSESGMSSSFDISQALNYFHENGVALHYADNPVLKDCVFHNINFIVDLFKFVFNHNIREVFQYNTNQAVQGAFRAQEFQMALDQYEQEGLLSIKLLKVFWHHYEMTDHESKALLELMKGFDICYPVTADERLFYLPWFTELKECPGHINTDDIYRTTDELVAQVFCIEFFNQIPINVFEVLCSRLQKLAIEKNYLGDRFAWKDGLLIQFGDTKCLLERCEDISTIKVCVQGKVDNLREVCEVTRSIRRAHTSILDEYEGVLKDDYMLCCHCLVCGKVPVKKWLPQEVFPETAARIQEITCGRDTVPRALVVSLTAFPESDSDVSAVKSYLKRFKVKRPPRVLYVDCLQVSAEQFQLSWRYSSTADLTKVEVKEKSGVWRCFCTQKCQSCRFTGSASAFRIAPITNGQQGDFVEVKPVFGISDCQLSASDKQMMTECHDAFCVMTNVFQIVSRLYSVIAKTNSQLQQLRRYLENQAPSAAASHLMEDVYRMTYRELYFFKKCLKETGQNLLAKAVVVRLQDGAVMKFEDI